jgi:hypothetical protein
MDVVIALAVFWGPIAVIGLVIYATRGTEFGRKFADFISGGGDKLWPPDR